MLKLNKTFFFVKYYCRNIIAADVKDERWTMDNQAGIVGLLWAPVNWSGKRDHSWLYKLILPVLVSWASDLMGGESVTDNSVKITY